MKVAIFLPSLAGGGAERIALFVTGRLAAAGIDADLVVAVADGALANHPVYRAHGVDLGAPNELLSLPAFAALCRRGASRPAVRVRPQRQDDRRAGGEAATVAAPRDQRPQCAGGAAPRPLLAPRGCWATRRSVGCIATWWPRTPSRAISPHRWCGSSRCRRDRVHTIYNPLPEARGGGRDRSRT
ncbi:hypothetical protein [Sphingomonas adhaesiva]|uniref:hypothetical protein n=1 Tax=Sphingomonas adhaesiva TaxID=28212 RepID=UPI002FFA42C4